MTILSTCKKTLFSVSLITSLSIAGAANAGLINSDFSQGLAGQQLNNWNGAVVDYSTNPLGDLIENVDFGLYSDIFSTNENSVSLSTSFDIGEAYLHQDFSFENDVSEFSLNFSHSDELFTFDAFNIVLSDTSGFHHNFVTDGLVADVSSLAGQLASFEISLADLDFIDDTFTVSDISITSVDVPEPSTFAIFALSLLALRHRAISSKRS